MAETQGWIKLHRKLLENPVVCKDAAHLAIWIYLLLNATHRDMDAIFQGKRITLKPGQLITGRKSISKQLGVSESKTNRVLFALENDHQIERQRSNKNSLISILNWDKYQEGGQQNGRQANNKRTTSEQQVNTNKNVKNVRSSCCCLRAREDISKCFEEYFGSIPVEAEIDEIGLWAEDWYSNNDPVDAEEVLREAFKASMKAGKKNVAYIAGFFKTLQKNRIKTADQFWVYQAEYDNAKK